MGARRRNDGAAIRAAISAAVDFPDQQALTAELADRIKRMAASHDETAAALAQPKASRPAGVTDKAFKEANDLFGLIDKLSTRIAIAIKLQDRLHRSDDGDQATRLDHAQFERRHDAGHPQSAWRQAGLAHGDERLLGDVGKYTVGPGRPLKTGRERSHAAGASHRHDRQGRQCLLRSGLCGAADEGADRADRRSADRERTSDDWSNISIAQAGADPGHRDHRARRRQGSRRRSAFACAVEPHRPALS